MISYQCNSSINKVCIHHKQPLHQRRSHTSAGAVSLGYIQQLLYGLLVCVVIVCVLLPAPCHGGRRKHRHGTRHVENFTCNKTINGSAVSDGYYSSTVLKPPPITSELVGEALYCVYVFHGVPGQRIMLKIRQLSLGQYDPQLPGCKHGLLRIWDGFSEPGRHPYPPNILCGHKQADLRDITKFTTQSKAMIEYEISYARVYMKFELSYKFLNMELEADLYAEQFTHDMKPTPESVSICDWTIELDHCTSSGECQILSPGYPGMYPPNTECVYHVISQDPDVMIQINFQGQAITSKLRSFNLRPSLGCREDYLSIRDNNIEGSPEIARYCGKETNDIVTTGNDITMRFVTGTEKSPFGFNGFHLSVTEITKEWNPFGNHVQNSLCNWRFNSSRGSISTPDHWLPPHASCMYTFDVLPQHFLKLRFNVYGLRSGCDDNIYVYDNGNIKSRLCDSNIPRPRDDEEENQDNSKHEDQLTFTLDGPTAAVVYSTKKGQYQGHTHNGFWLSFQQMPNPTASGYGENIVLENMLVEDYNKRRNDHSHGNTLHKVTLFNFKNLLFSLTVQIVVVFGTIHGFRLR